MCSADCRPPWTRTSTHRHPAADELEAHPNARLTAPLRRLLSSAGSGGMGLPDGYTDPHHHRRKTLLQRLQCLLHVQLPPPAAQIRLRRNRCSVATAAHSCVADSFESPKIWPCASSAKQQRPGARRCRSARQTQRLRDRLAPANRSASTRLKNARSATLIGPLLPEPPEIVPIPPAATPLSRAIRLDQPDRPKALSYK